MKTLLSAILAAACSSHQAWKAPFFKFYFRHNVKIIKMFTKVLWVINLSSTKTQALVFSKMMLRLTPVTGPFHQTFWAPSREGWLSEWAAGARLLPVNAKPGLGPSGGTTHWFGSKYFFNNITALKAFWKTKSEVFKEGCFSKVSPGGLSVTEASPFDLTWKRGFALPETALNYTLLYRALWDAVKLYLKYIPFYAPIIYH